ncbi:hypothetical protein JCM11957_16890 [Caminibacter profundus]
MNAEKFFEKYSLEEISKRTKISPITLRFIKNKEYDKVQRVKFIGFINLIQREFNIDLSELIEEYDQVYNTSYKEEKTHTEKNEKNNLIFILAIILLIVTGTIIYKYTTSSKNSLLEINTTSQNSSTTNFEKIYNKNTLEINSSVINEDNSSLKNENNSSKNESNLSSKNKSNSSTEKKLLIPKTITIIPKEKLWYRAINLDTNKTFEFLTSKPKTLTGSNYFIKFGHGNLTIEYGNKIIEPNTKKIIRILFKEGNFSYVKKGYKP